MTKLCECALRGLQGLTGVSDQKINTYLKFYAALHFLKMTDYNLTDFLFTWFGLVKQVFHGKQF